MFLIGVWHGAGYQFAVFGLMHGFFLVTNHGFRAIRPTWLKPSRAGAALSVAFTFLCVVVSLVYFRADTLAEAWTLTRGLVGLNGLALPGVAKAPLAALGIGEGSWLTFGTSLMRVDDLVFALSPLPLVWLLPNTQQWMHTAAIGTDRTDPALQPGLLRWIGPWRPTPAGAVVVSLLLGLALSKVVSSAPSRFLYFNF